MDPRSWANPPKTKPSLPVYISMCTQFFFQSKHETSHTNGGKTPLGVTRPKQPMFKTPYYSVFEFLQLVELLSDTVHSLNLHYFLQKSPRREVVRSSAGASGVYPPFLGSFA